MGEEGPWERDYDQSWGRGEGFKPRPVVIQFMDGGGTFKFLVTREMFERIKRDSQRLDAEYHRTLRERRLREERLREEQEKLRRQQEEFRRRQERSRSYDGVYFGPGGLDPEEILENLFKTSEAFKNFSFTMNGATYNFSGGTQAPPRQSPPRQDPPRFSTPPKPEMPRARTKDAMMRRLCELAKVDYPSELEVKRLLRRAQRECHPDSGGSHDLWIELDELQRLLRI